MARTLLALALLGLAVGAAHGLRPLAGAEETHVTRRLLDSVTSVIAAYPTSGNPGDACAINTVSGPGPDPSTPGAFFSVPLGESLTVATQRQDSTHFYEITGSSGGPQEFSVNTDANGFESVTFTPQGVGHSGFAQLNYMVGVSPYFNATLGRPLCQFQIRFVGIPSSSPSPPPPSPTPTPPAPGACSGAVPCYCQNGYCFNNGATLTQTCAPPAGQSCTPVTINPSSIGVQYAYGYPATVNVCQCSPATNG